MHPALNPFPQQNDARKFLVSSSSLPQWVVQFFDGVYAQCDLVWDAQMKQEVAQFVEQSALHCGIDGKRFFDQCCGRGDLSHALIDRGWTGVGVDQNQSYIDHATQNALHDNGVSAGTFICADAGSFVCRPAADVGINWHTSLGYGGVEGAKALWSCLRSSVKPSGLYILDLRNLSHYMEQPLVQEKEVVLPQIGPATLLRRGVWDNHTLTQQWSLYGKDGSCIWFQDNASCFHPSIQDIERLCQMFSDRLLGVYGGMDYHELSSSDPRMLALVERGD